MHRLCFLLLLLAGAARAGDCHDLQRALLPDPAPDAAAIDAARQACEREAAAGDAQAGYRLALFDLGLGGRWDPERAIPLMRDAAEAGVSEAQYWLAWQHESGPLLGRDAAAALGWYQRAAAADHRLALARLAAAYAAGELGLPADQARAAEYRARQARCLRREAGAP